MTPAIWSDVEDDLETACLAAAQAVAKAATLQDMPAAFRADRETAIGKHLHDAFSAAEKALRRIVAAVDDSLPASGNFHRDLIERAARPDADRRPAIVTAETAAGLGLAPRA
ncbi:MAG TPA: hypothetical protein VGN83_15150 [Falsiroseomonas sp.]|nr:hypothetical protein [Falsiroseomonas sp.]